MFCRGKIIPRIAGKRANIYANPAIPGAKGTSNTYFFGAAKLISNNNATIREACLSNHIRAFLVVSAGFFKFNKIFTV